MSRNGAGTFNRAHDFTDDAAAAIKIRADRMDEEIDGIATALSASIANDGQTTILADLPMSTFKHTGVGNATARNQYATVASLQDGSHNWVAAGGTADAITATYAPALTALVDGQLCYVRALGANTVTTPTFAPNGLTAHTITKAGGTALGIGDIPAALAEITLRYNLANTRWELVNPTRAAAAVTATGSNVTVNASGVNVCSISVPAGKWKLSATVSYTGPGSTGAVGAAFCMGTTSGSFSGSVAGFDKSSFVIAAASAMGGGSIPGVTINLTTTTTYYLVAAFLGSTSDTLSGTLRAEPIV